MIISDDFFMLKYSFLIDLRLKKMHDKAVNLCLLPLNFFPNWFVTSKIIKKIVTAKFSNFFGNSDSDIFKFFSKDIS